MMMSFYECGGGLPQKTSSKQLKDRWKETPWRDQNTKCTFWFNWFVLLQKWWWRWRRGGMENITFPELRFGTKWHPERKLSLISAKEQKHDKKRTIRRTEQNTRVRIVPHPLIGFVSLALIICHTTVSLAGPHIWKHLLTHLQAAPPSL